MPSRRLFASLAALLFALALVIPWSWERYLASLPPLDLDVTRAASTIVIDRNARLLRAFTTDDGRWRLPLTRNEVDPRFFQLLTAYEDGRFNEHSGVDYRAMARAAGQMVTSGHVVSGGYTVSPGGLSSTNYAVTYLPGTLTVNPDPLTIKAVDQTKPYGGTLPTLTASYTGFVNGDSSASLIGL